MGNKGSNTTTTSSAPAPQAMQAYQYLLDRAGGVAQTPFQAYGGDLTAPVNAQQNLGISNINQGAGVAQPYIQQASDYARQAATPLTQAQIQQYQSPHTQAVVDATSNWFNQQNQQQQQNVLGNAAAQGALGGDRVGVAQANLASQQTASQAPIIAGLYNQGYNTALQTAQQQQANLGNAAYSFGNLGVAGQNAALTGANAQVGAGSLQQQNEQQRLNALYQQWQIAQAFPYQQTQWLAGINTGVGSQMGGTGSTTAPAPSPWGQVLGGGLAAAAMFVKDGGRIKGFAPGGSVDDAPFAGVGWIPGRAITMGRGAPPPPGVGSPQNTNPDFGKMASSFAGRRKSSGVGAPMDISSGVGGFSPSTLGETLPMGLSPQAGFGMGPIYRDGGGVHGYDLGGDVVDEGPMTFADRWGPTTDALKVGAFDPQGLNSVTPTVSDAGVVPLPRPRPDEAPQMNMGVAAADVDPATGASSRSFAPTDGVSGFAAQPDTVPPRISAPFEIPPEQSAEQPTRKFGLGLLPDNLRMPLLTAGLAMMASRSPNLGNAIGEGGLAGVGAYTQQKQQEAVREEKKEALGITKRRLDMDSRRLDQAADDARKRLAETSRHNVATEQRALLPPGYRKSAEGGLEPIPGGPADPKIIKEHAEAKLAEGGLLDDDTTKFMAQQYRAGDTSVLTNLGRGAQGAQNIIKVRREVKRQNEAEGLGGADQALRNAEFFGTKSGQRTLGTKQANIELAATEFKQVLPVVREASKAVSRTNYPDLNRIIQMGQEKTGNPAIVAFGGGINTLINLYARAISPSGVPTVSDKDHAREILTKSWSQGQFDAAVGMMEKEIDAALTSPEKVRDDMRKRFIEGQRGAPKVGDRKEFKQGWGVWDGKQYVPEKKP